MKTESFVTICTPVSRCNPELYLDFDDPKAEEICYVSKGNVVEDFVKKDTSRISKAEYRSKFKLELHGKLFPNTELEVTILTKDEDMIEAITNKFESKGINWFLEVRLRENNDETT